MFRATNLASISFKFSPRMYNYNDDAVHHTLAYTIYTSRILYNLICDKMRRIDFNQ